MAGPPSLEGESKTVTVSAIQTSMQMGASTIAKTLELKRNPPSFYYGKETSGNWLKVSGNEEAKIGDVVRISYRMRIPFFQKWQMENFIEKMQKDSRLQLRYIAMSEEESTIWVEAKVLQPFSPLLLFAGAVLALAVGAGIFITVQSIERLGTVDTPIGSVNFIGFITLGVTAIFVLSAVKAYRT